MGRRRRALALIAILGGAALAAPLSVLEVEGGASRRTLALEPGSGFQYGYRHSIYDAPVAEHFLLDGQRLRLTEVRSTSREALEYFRWPGPVRDEGSWLSVRPPDVREDQLTIRVAAGAQQRIHGAGTLDLAALEADVVQVRAGTRPLAVWLALRLGLAGR